MHHRFLGLTAALALGLPLLAMAQTRPDPSDPKAPSRPLGHRSAFADYQPFQDITPGDWRRLNDTVGTAALKQGGAGSTAPPAATPAPSPAASAPSKPMPMPGHHQHMHGGRK